MTVIRAIGKNTLGDNNKMKVAMREYEMSTHDLSFVFRNTQAPGTLVPFMKLPAQKGDIWDIQLFNKTLTHPTIGPLFGNYKLQHFIFSCPIRLYNSWLHNNRTGIGMNMKQVKMPKLQVPNSNSQNFKNPANPSSLLAYMGFRGAKTQSAAGASWNKVNALPFLMYYDIFKNYFANKQEENAYYIGGLSKVADSISVIQSDGTTSNYTLKGIEWTSVQDDFTQTTQLRVNNLNNQVTPKQFWKNLELRLSKDGVLGSRIAATQTSDTSGTTITLDKAETETFNRITGIREAIEWDFEGVQLLPFKLENVDLMRDKILQTPGNSTLLITESDLEPYGALKRTFISDFQQFGLCVKTYDSDIFNNWVNTDWIDGEGGISEITAVSTEGNELNLDSLNLAQKVYNMLNRIAVSGGTYRDWLETVYTAGNYLERPETPVFEGGMTQWIEFDEVISSAATIDEPLGTLAGRGKTTKQRGSGKLHIRIHEPSYIIGICAITPMVDYSQGNEWDMIDIDTMDDWHKPALDGIGYQDSLCVNRAWWAMDALANGTYKSPSPGKTVAWINYMTNYNKSFGEFASGQSEEFMVLNRNYEENSEGANIQDLTTYIDPSKHNNIFADRKLSAMNFWLQTACDIKVRRNISAKQIPNL
uniref:Major capsid protein n=1 Tax=Dulem virus 214 TaxID=3145691 RepID=A0AAU8B0A4_9VIRU